MSDGKPGSYFPQPRQETSHPDIKVPNRKTREAMAEAEEIIRLYKARFRHAESMVDAPDENSSK